MSSVERYFTPSGLDMRVFNREQPSRTHFALACVIISNVRQHEREAFTLVLFKSENAWVKGWKKVINRLTNLGILIASSNLFELSKGPSIRACKVSKFHLVWSLVATTCVSIIDPWKTRSSICMLILSLTCSTWRCPRRTASSTESALMSKLI